MSDYWCLTCGGRVGMIGHGIHNEDLIAKIDELVASGMKRPDAIEAVGKWQIGDKPEPMPAAMTNETECDFVPCERTVRLCIEKLPAEAEAAEHPGEVVYATCKASLEAVLPKKDRAEELVEAFSASRITGDSHSKLAFASWLIAQGEIRG